MGKFDRKIGDEIEKFENIRENIGFIVSQSPMTSNFGFGLWAQQFHEKRGGKFKKFNWKRWQNWKILKISWKNRWYSWKLDTLKEK